jgi:hypothetical protein
MVQKVYIRTTEQVWTCLLDSSARMQIMKAWWNWTKNKSGQGCRARLTGKATVQSCWGKAAGQGRRARLAGKAGEQGCRARPGCLTRLAGKAGGQGCRAWRNPNLVEIGRNSKYFWMHGEIAITSARIIQIRSKLFEIQNISECIAHVIQIWSKLVETRTTWWNMV